MAQKKSGKNPGVHVTQRDNGWAVIKEGAKRASSTYPTQEKAISEARRVARNEKSELHVHGRDGKVRDRVSYGNDPHPPRG